MYIHTHICMHKYIFKNITTISISFLSSFKKFNIALVTYFYQAISVSEICYCKNTSVSLRGIDLRPNPHQVILLGYRSPSTVLLTDTLHNKKEKKSAA